MMQRTRADRGIRIFVRRTPPPVVVQLSVAEHHTLMQFAQSWPERLSRGQAAKLLILAALSEVGDPKDRSVSK